MRKFFIVCFMLVSFFVFADDEPIFSDIPGSYAIYHDLRFNNDVIIGICYVGDNTILARSYETKTKNELLILIPFVRTDSGIDIGNNLNVLKGDLNASDSTSRLLPMIMNWSNSWYKSKSEIDTKNQYFISTDDDFYYLSWIPVFQIQTIGKKEEFSVISVGKLKDNKDSRFFGFTQLPNPIKSDTYEIKKGKPLDVVIDGLKVPLDSNWKSDDGKVYRITTKSPQDSVFTIETLDYKKVGFKSLKQFVNIMLISNTDVIVLTDGSNVTFKDGNYNIVMRMFDPIQKKVTVQQTQFIERDKDVVSLATLACYETLYLKNKSFFDAIIN